MRKKSKIKVKKKKIQKENKQQNFVGKKKQNEPSYPKSYKQSYATHKASPQLF